MPHGEPLGVKGVVIRPGNAQLKVSLMPAVSGIPGRVAIDPLPVQPDGIPGVVDVVILFFCPKPGGAGPVKRHTGNTHTVQKLRK